MSITLAIVGTTNHSLMKFAVEKTLQCVPVDKIKIFSDKQVDVPNSEFIKLKTPFSLSDYSVFMIKELVNYIDTDHVLICQYDGFAVNKEFWNEKYLQYDYIGSATYYKHPPLLQTLTQCDLVKSLENSWYSLGGGFCLRSKKLLEALRDDKILADFQNYELNCRWTCEDISIGIIYKKYLEENYGIKFGSIEDSIEFSAEILSNYSFCLGFHGWDQVPLFLNQKDTMFYIQEYIKYNGTFNVNHAKLKKFLGFCNVKQYDNVVHHLKRVYPNL